ncbi:ostA-like family protein [Gloeobacter morelensis MG652769]|uniref:OstA-like family protein n=2 Tax=Gloeobacter TaxID=33071 RepID=A0ABY3PKS7_9CYAN|nr:ostA-like family protein [Gloeobacter morelensis MG652769]
MDEISSASCAMVPGTSGARGIIGKSEGWLKMGRMALWAISALMAASVLMSQAIAAQTASRAGAGGGGQLKITSDIQEADTKSGVVIARGNVRIEYPARKVVATAEKATYLRDEKKIILSGNVRVVQDENRMNAEVMTYFIDKGLFDAQPPSGKQVEAVYTVPPSEDPQEPPQKTSESKPQQ